MVDQDDKNQILDRRTIGFSHIQNCIPRDFGPVIGAYGVAVYVLLCSYAGVKKQSWPSKKTMGERLRLSVSTINRTIKILAAMKLIRVCRRKRPDGGKASNIYILVDPPTPIVPTEPYPHSSHGTIPIVPTEPSEKDTDRRIKLSAENPADSARNSPEKTADGKSVNGRKRDFNPPRNNPQDALSPSGFFQNVAGDSDKPTYPELAAGRLWEIASKSRQLDRRSSRIKWAATIRRWIVESDIDLNEFETELVWYEQHHGEEFVPQAYSAETFCRKFMDIRRARFRDAKKNGEMTVEERQENTAMHGGYDPLAETPISIIRREDQTPEMREWGDFNRNCPGHDLSLIQFTKLRKHFSGLSHMEIDDFCIKKRPDELWAYADSLPD